MSWATLRPQIVDLLNDNTNIHEVSNHPKIKFSGYPAAYVVAAESDNLYETNKENIRTYAFVIRLFYETKHSGVGDAISALEGIVDSTIDAFDQEDLKGADTRKIGVGLPANYTFIKIWATPSIWGELPEEELIMAEIAVRVRISIDIS